MKNWIGTETEEKDAPRAVSTADSSANCEQRQIADDIAGQRKGERRKGKEERVGGREERQRKGEGKEEKGA